MTQYDRPTSDISTGSWTDEGSVDNDNNLYTSLDEVSQGGDDSYVSGTSGAGTFEAKLGNLTDPVGNTSHIVHIYGEGVGSGGPEKVDLYLYEGAGLIATIANNWAPGRSAYADVNYTLSSGEADSISNYTDLRVRVVEDSIGGDEFRVTQIYMEVPDAAGAKVNKDLEAKWDINNLVNNDLNAKFDIFNLVNKDLDAQFDIFNLVNKDLQADWDIAELINKDFQAVWDMEGSVNKDLSAQWDLMELVNKDLDAQWDVANLVNKDFQVIWDMESLVNKDLQIIYGILSVDAGRRKEHSGFKFWRF